MPACPALDSPEPRRQVQIRMPLSTHQRVVAAATRLGVTAQVLYRRWLGRVSETIESHPLFGPGVPLVTTVLQNPRVLSASTERRCRHGERYWWLRDDHGFLPLTAARSVQGHGANGTYRATHPIRVEIDLAPGTYTLGAGPSVPHGGVRHHVVVERP